jgi:hypothetical protein
MIAGALGYTDLDHPEWIDQCAREITRHAEAIS